jgi:hypothetical protein
MLLAIEEVACAKGFAPIAVTSDEEIRCPFLVARSILGSRWSSTPLPLTALLSRQSPTSATPSLI